jgi:2-polyprenyl-6-methoxyphenol hydroxylase-like FAD-dependent oxidoreductase
MPPTPTRTSSSPARRTLVVGGGIGGLAAAIALRDAGWEVMVLERSAVHGAPAAGLALWPNGVRALYRLGLGPALDGIATRVPEIAIRRPDGTPLARYDGAALERRWGAPLVAVHRAELLAVLLERLGRDAVRSGAEVELVEEGGVRLTDGTVLEGDLVVGADGLRSVTRSAVLCDGEPRPAGLVAFRGVAHCDRLVRSGEWWGAGAIAGLLPLTGGRVYWYVACHERDEEPVAALADRLAAPVADTVAATPAGTVLRYPLADRRPVRQLVGPRIALVATCLGRALATADLATALRRYERERGPASARLVRGSRSAARLALARSPLVRSARDRLLAATPQALHLRRLGRLLQLPPAPAEAVA